MRKLTLDDIKDVRAYEREREEFRARIIALKKRRRVSLGDLMTIVFENADTMRFQIQEMARVERISTDEQLQHEVDTYNELVPEEGELRATLLIELTTDEQLREWLPKLVGVQRAVSLWLGDGSRIPVEPLDEERLTREEVTAAVHFLRFSFSSDQVAACASGTVRVVVDHEHYDVVADLTGDQQAELLADLTR